jgi:hypothetical protein
MPWNSAKDGDWSHADYSKPPWAPGIMTLTHEEVLHVQTETQKIIDAFIAANGYNPPANEWVVPRYNELDWEKCINGDTYAVIVGYDPAVHTLGIDGSGIVYPDPIEEPEQPTEPEPEQPTQEPETIEEP